MSWLVQHMSQVLVQRMSQVLAQRMSQVLVQRMSRVLVHCRLELQKLLLAWTHWTRSAQGQLPQAVVRHMSLKVQHMS
jgi:hypothetical protein